MEYILALDAGTGSGRAVLFDRDGRQKAVSQREWTHKEDPRYPGSMDFDTDVNWRLLQGCIQDVLAEIPRGRIAAVVATSMREGIVLYDKDQREIWACANVDARAVDEVRAFRREHPEAERKAYERTGQTLALGAPARLMWLRSHEPHVFDRIEDMVMLSDWIAIRLGAGHHVDPSNGCTTGLFSVESREWDSETIGLFGLPDTVSNAKVREAGTMIGSVSKNAADETGIPAGTPIVMGGGDAQLGSVGVGAVRAGEAAVFGGTFWQQEVNLGNPVIDRTGRMRINCAAVSDMWQAEAIVFFAGLVMRWFRDAMCPDIVRDAKRDKKDPYTVLEDMAASVPAGAGGMIGVFSDAMDYSHWRHAAPSLLNLSLDPEKSSRAAIFRGLQENAALVTRANIERIADLLGAFPESIILGGGAAKGTLWPQIVSDVLGIPVKTPVVKEATALGAAMFGMVGVEWYDSITDAQKEIVQYDREFAPQNETRAVYDEAYAKWQRAYAPQLELSDSGVTQSMWRAPGE